MENMSSIKYPSMVSLVTATAPTISSNFDLNLDALEALCKSGAIEVTYPASWQKK